MQSLGNGWRERDCALADEYDTMQDTGVKLLAQVVRESLVV